MRGGRRWQASSKIGVMKSYRKFQKLRVEESRTLGCNMSFKDYNKRDVITNVINAQNLRQKTKGDQQNKRNASHRVRSRSKASKKKSSPSHNLEMRTIWLGAKGKKFRYKNLMQSLLSKLLTVEVATVVKSPC
jgi:hypothetical protein